MARRRLWAISRRSSRRRNRKSMSDGRARTLALRLLARCASSLQRCPSTCRQQPRRLRLLLARADTSLLSDAAACRWRSATVNSSTGSSPRNHRLEPRGAGKSGQTKWRQRKTPPRDLRRRRPCARARRQRARELAALARRETSAAVAAASAILRRARRRDPLGRAAALRRRRRVGGGRAARRLGEVEPGLVSEAARAARLESLTSGGDEPRAAERRGGVGRAPPRGRPRRPPPPRPPAAPPPVEAVGAGGWRWSAGARRARRRRLQLQVMTPPPCGRPGIPRRPRCARRLLGNARA